MIYRYPMLLAAFIWLLLPHLRAIAQPHIIGDSICFWLETPAAQEIFLAGDFNNWNPANLPLSCEEGVWGRNLKLAPGYYQYRFIVDGNWMADPNNPATVLNNAGQPNSVFRYRLDGTIEYAAYSPGNQTRTADDYPATGGKLYLALIWHQHQPFYLDAAQDQLIAPWVRTHATKDYYDMAATLRSYPAVHVTINLTPVLLLQIEKYYLERLGPFYDSTSNRIHAAELLQQWKGHTDPWVDLMLTPTAEFSAQDLEYLYGGDWNCFGISRVQIARFPEYAALRAKPTSEYTLQDRLNLKCWFYLAHFDPDFLRGSVELETGFTVDITDIISETTPGIFTRGQSFSEDDANRLLAETYKVMAAIIPVHRQLMYHPASRQGQVEISTTPFYHPILPLIANTRNDCSDASSCKGCPDFCRPEDALQQVGQAVEYYHRWFGKAPTGMWPAEGAVSEETLQDYALNNIAWIATGDGVLEKSLGPMANKDTPYRCVTPERGAIAAFFRNTALSDYIGFKYQAYTGEEAADDFIRQILSHSPSPGAGDRLLTIILDGENAWEWYERDVDAKDFLHALYRKLEALYASGQVVTVTPIEYLLGNPARGVPAHPLLTLPELPRLASGSWINADFSTWIGEEEENRAWEWLARVRRDLESATGPHALLPERPSREQQLMELAWQEMYAAEGSDWFWWYGDDQNAPGGERVFDRLFRNHLQQVYRYLQDAGCNILAPNIPCLLLQPGQEGDEQDATHH